jgi:hypothetical protein
MKKWLIIVVMIAAMAMMVMPVSAYWQSWYVDNPADTQIDGLSDVRWINALSNPNFNYWIDRYNVNNGNFQLEVGYYFGEVPYPLPNAARHNTDWGNGAQGYTFGVDDESGPDGQMGMGYYNDPSGWDDAADQSELIQNYEGMTTYVQWIPFFDPFAYGEYYNWDPEALAWDPGNSVVI